ncbi:citrate lyase holo-[acyl-carrier protein] synthase [Aerococcaceae bacterium DSM 111021]|nr:citrate lyase holo-[acyl-carrier protein] synthase [Aerococcaceae bacterium DSM 111021]
MYKDEVFNGPEVSLMEMLDAREKRAFRQTQIINQHSPGSLLSVTLNIPGNIKTSLYLVGVFEEMLTEIKAKLDDVTIQFSEDLNLPTGPEAYFFVDIDSIELKKRMVALEETHSKGRVFDLDVVKLEDGKLSSLKREEVGVGKRQCYICDRPAKECARSRKHSIEESQEAIANILLG